VKELAEELHPLGYGGKWEIVISTNYACLLEEFSLDVSAYLDPLRADTDGDGIKDGAELTPEENQGWITNPMLKDTDGDGWSDHKEIYEKNTNPLSMDTDADGIIDPRDRKRTHGASKNISEPEVTGHAGRQENKSGYLLHEEKSVRRKRKRLAYEILLGLLGR